MEESNIIKYDGSQLQKVTNIIAVTNKLLGLAEPRLIPYRKKDKWGFCTPDMKIVIDCVYDEVFRFSKGVANVRINDERWFIDKKGTKVSEIIEKSVVKKDDSSEILTGTNINNKWGFIDKEGILVIPCVYDDVTYFKDGLARAKLNGKYGFIDRSNRQIVPFIYDFAERCFQDDMVRVGLDGKYGYYNREGLQTIPCIYDGFSGLSYSDGLVSIRLNGKYGFIDKNGNIVIPFNYSFVYSFKDELAMTYMSVNGKSGYINKAGIQYWED